jgi:hypothetical protein
MGPKASIKTAVDSNTHMSNSNSLLVSNTQMSNNSNSMVGAIIKIIKISPYTINNNNKISAGL